MIFVLPEADKIRQIRLLNMHTFTADHETAVSPRSSGLTSCANENLQSSEFSLLSSGDLPVR